MRRGRYLFVLNSGETPAVVRTRGTDLLTGERADGSVVVARNGAAVIREEGD